MRRDNKRKKWLSTYINKKNKGFNGNIYIQGKAKEDNNTKGPLEDEPWPDEIPPVIVSILRKRAYKLTKSRRKAKTKRYGLKKRGINKRGENK